MGFEYTRLPLDSKIPVGWVKGKILMFDVPRKFPKKVKPKEERVTSAWLELLKGLTPKQQKKEHFKRKLREQKFH